MGGADFAEIAVAGGVLCFRCSRVSGDDWLDDISGDIGESEVAAGVAVGELFVVESEEVQDGGVEVVDMHAVVNGTKAEFVRFAPCHAATDTAACEEGGEAVVIVVTSGAIFRGGSASEFAAPEDEGVIEESALFEVREESGDGAIDGVAEVASGIVVITVCVPWLSVAIVDLDEANAAFSESAGEQAAVGEVSLSVEFAGGFGFLLQVKGVGGGELHSEGGFHGLNAGFELAVFAGAFDVASIEAVHQFKLCGLGDAVAGEIAKEGDEFVGSGIGVVDIGALVRSWEEGAGPEDGEANGFAGAEDDVGGEVLVFGAESP